MAENGADGVELDEVDVEEFLRAGKKIPKGKQYKIRIDRTKYIVGRAKWSGLELLGLVEKAPDKWRLQQKFAGGQMKELRPDEIVDLSEDGVERFVTIECSQTDGEAMTARRAFRLPEDDEDYFNTLGVVWETVQDQGGRWLLLHDHPVPVGFTPTSTTLAFRVEGGYPPGKLDMYYTFPAITRADGGALAAVTTEQIDGKTFQRWSRHYEWRDGVDSLSTHHIRTQRTLETDAVR